METFADRLTNLRKKHELTVTEACELLEVPYGTYYHWANGEAFPRPDTIKKIAEAFNVTTEYLMKGEPEKNTDDTTDEGKADRPTDGQSFLGQVKEAVKQTHDRSARVIRYTAKDECDLQDINTVISQIKFMDLPSARKKRIHKLMSEYRMELECKVFYGDTTL